MDINLTEGDDQVVHPALTDEWNNYFGKGGNDSFVVYLGNIVGGPGNDRIEQLASGDWWRTLTVAYWESPKGVVVDLEAGYAEDGYGTRDTLVGVQRISGSWQDDKLYGSSLYNEFYIGGGHSVVDGRGGEDLMWLPDFVPGIGLKDFTITMAIDGRSGVATWSGRKEFSVQFSNVERIGIGGSNTSVYVSNFIQPERMAREGLVGNDAQRWNAGSALGTAVELTYSFATSAPASGPGAKGFAAFDASQKATVRAILNSLAEVTGLSFRETSAGNASLTFGASAQDATKGVAAMPGQPGAGQVWMDIDSVRDLSPGSEGYAALLHEIGHALGLRHPRNVDAGDAWSAQWRAEDDVTAHSVMAQGASPDGLFRSTWGALDITALRHLYGSRGSNAGDTVHKLGSAQFQSQSAIVDDGGADILDASASTVGVALDLTPGALSSAGVTRAGAAAVDNLGIAPGSWIEAAVGSALDDVLVGNRLDNRLRGGLGNDWIDGADGADTAVFEGKRSDYLISTGFGKIFVTARDGSSGFDTLLNVEQLGFADATLVFGAAGLAADAVIEVDQNAAVSGSLPAASDGALVSYKIKAAPAHGSLTLGGAGDFVYTPQRGYAGEDRFTFTVTDSKGSNDYVGFVGVRQLSAAPGGTEGNDSLAGGAGDDTLAAGGGNDRIAASAGFDHIDAGAGFDTVRYEGARAGVKFTRNEDGSVNAAKAGGADHLVGVERALFADGSAVAFDIDGAAGQTYRVYQAAFDRKPDVPGLSFWMFNMDNGVSLESVARGFLESPEAIKLYGANASAEEFVSKLYNNVLHRAPEQAGYDFWVQAVKAGYARSEVLAQFAESAENRAQVIGAIEGGIDYSPFGA